jgi:hypothetical protein
MAPLAPEELLIFFQSALIRIAGDPGRSKKRCVAGPGTSGIVPGGCAGSITLEMATSAFFWPTRLVADGVAMQLSGRSHHFNRDEEGE